MKPLEPKDVKFGYEIYNKEAIELSRLAEVVEGLKEEAYCMNCKEDYEKDIDKCLEHVNGIHYWMVNFKMIDEAFGEVLKEK